MNFNRIDMSAGKDRRRGLVRRETIVVLVEQLSLAQRAGQWLSNETHGDAYGQVREINEHLHQAQRKLRDFQNGAAKSGERAAGGMDLKFE